ncbi:MAG: DUF3846 domain-containing protein, partial [Clostridiales bacterium]|nr:DUF3846 domain-containing protein [Clostridiales bacterium]
MVERRINHDQRRSCRAGAADVGGDSAGVLRRAQGRQERAAAEGRRLVRGDYISDQKPQEEKAMNKIKVIIKRPDSKPYTTWISNSLENLQRTVGGYIETVTLATDCVLIVNEE